MFPASLLTLLLVLLITGSLVKAANSPTSVPITSRLNFPNGTYNLVAHDRARSQALRDRSNHGQRLIDVPLINNVFVYTISVDVGNPPTSYDLILDTGSAITWVGASTPYQQTPTSVSTHQHISVTYEMGFFTGTVFLDTVTVGPGLTVVGQEIGVAYNAQGFVRYDGVLGIGPVALTLNTLTLTPTVSVPTVANRLAGEGTIEANILGVFFKPYGGSQAATAGQLTFGGTDPALHTTGITYAFVTARAPASNYWGIDQSITYGAAPILANAVGIVDSGHNLIALATEAFQLYQAATGAQSDPMTGLLVITANQYTVMQNLNFHIDGRTFALTPNAQIWPRVLNYRIGGQYGSIYLVVRDIGTQVGQGDYDIINSYVFMQRFYTVFDTANSRVGFAQTQFTAANTN
ncbi:aspartic peptidase A1 [Suillus decipiens]|nr:aspartic peptidase A1 [Suillus decipiens]